MIAFLAGVAVGAVFVWAIVEVGHRRRRVDELERMYRRAGVAPRDDAAERLRDRGRSW